MKLIIYFSKATREMTPDDLQSLLQHARTYNVDHGITGLLLYDDGCFLQGLEGEEKEVTALYEKIARDSRHHDLIELYDQPISERSFPEWHMGFHQIEGHELTDQKGYHPVLKDNFSSEPIDMEDEMTFHLLCLFRQFVKDEHAR
ncbi:MAG: BLUF domain-containing protein [Verrucomicrobiota bacterium]